MSRKTRAVDEEDQPSDRKVRSVHHDEMRDLKALTNRIAALPLKVRRTLPLDEETQACLDILAAAEPKPARRRTLMRAKLLMGGVDPELLEAALAGKTPEAAILEETLQWRSRIVAGGDDDLQAFIVRYPDSDRQAVRTNAREARGKGPVAERAMARLLTLLREAAGGAVGARMR